MIRVESAIQSALIKWIKDNHPHLMVTATQNEKSYQETRQIGSIGITDLLLFKRMDILYVLFLELKKIKGTLKQSQKTWNIEFDTNYSAKNAMRAVAYGFLEAKDIITQWEKSI